MVTIYSYLGEYYDLTIIEPEPASFIVIQFMGFKNGLKQPRTVEMSIIVTSNIEVDYLFTIILFLLLVKMSTSVNRCYFGASYY